jgi:methionine synthase I (cobalamin-dependent)
VYSTSQPSSPTVYNNQVAISERPLLMDVLRSGRVLLMDGAMGTELQRLGLPPGENAAAWNLLHPERVEAVHRAYRDAGAEVLLSNTFLMLARWGDALPFRERLNSKGGAGIDLAWRLAHERIGVESCYRLAAVGPVTGNQSSREFDDLRSLRIPNADLFDAILLETCSTPRVRHALAHLGRSTTAPLFLSLSYHRDAKRRLVTASGHTPEWFASRAAAYGAAALGVNCGCEIGMDEMIESVRRYRQTTDLPLFARPNAGTPVRKGDTFVYPHTPQEMAERVWALLEAGAVMVGGCCGTTPAHIAAFRKVVDAWNAEVG